MVNLLVTAPLDFIPELKERASQEVQLTYAYQANENQVRDLLVSNSFNAWITSPCPSYLITGDLIDLCPTLLIVATPSTGSNHIDLTALDKRGIALYRLKDTEIVNQIYASSEFTFNLLISTIRKTPFAFDSVKKGKWREVENQYRGRELDGLTVGIVGYGRIGSNLSRYCQAFRMKVIAYDPHVKIDDPAVIQVDKIDQLLSVCDVVSPCVHLNEDTFGMINKSMFALMKDGVYFINTSRGEVVDEEALLEALYGGKVQAAGLDVIRDEFVGDKNVHPLIEYARCHDNLIITPHIAGLTYDSERKAQTAAYEAVLKHLKSI